MTPPPPDAHPPPGPPDGADDDGPPSAASRGEGPRRRAAPGGERGAAGGYGDGPAGDGAGSPDPAGERPAGALGAPPGGGGRTPGGARGAGVPAGSASGGHESGLRGALLALLGGQGADEEGPSADDLADVLWMARLIREDEVAEDAGAAPEDEPRADGPGVVPPPRRETPTAPVGPDAGPETAADLPPAPARTAPRVGLHPLGAGRPDGTGAGVAAGHVVQVAQPPALAGTLDLARALRPLRQSVDSPGPAQLDEDATAEVSAHAGRLIPVWQAAVERRFSVDLLVDTGPTMAVWHRLAVELCTVLERQGAFADVRCWSLDTDGPVPRLRPFRREQSGAEPAKAPRWSGPLEDPTGRAVLLVLTDGVGPAWYCPELPDFLARMTGERPAAVLQVLPRRLWHRTALRTVPVELRVPDPARPVAEVRTDAAVPGLPRGRRLPGARWLPVMEVDGGWLAPWAGLIGGRAPGWTPMLATAVRGVPRPRRADPASGSAQSPAAGAAPPSPRPSSPAAASPSPRPSPQSPASPPAPARPAPATPTGASPSPPSPPEPADRVTRFRSGCSPDAFRLACRLAAAPLSLPVMRLVQQATMPHSGQTDLAELFVSGLIERRGGLGPDPDETVYDFVPGVRGELLAELTRTESLHILEDVLAKVSGRVAATFGGTLDFRALAALAAGAAAKAEEDGDTGLSPDRLLPEASLPFAEVAVAVLSGAGGQHRALAERLAAAAEGRGWETEEDAEEDAAQSPAGVPHPEFLNPAAHPGPLPLMGRVAELDTMATALNPPQFPHPGPDPAVPAVVTVQARAGMGGSTLVREYVRRYGDRHGFVHWVDARTADSLLAGLADLARAAGLPTPEYPPADLWERLGAYRDWLLVLDGFWYGLDIGGIVAPLPSSGQCGVIITSEAVGGHLQPVTNLGLTELTTAEIANYLVEFAPDLLHRAPDMPQRLFEIARRLPALPAELARIDVPALLAAELGPRGGVESVPYREVEAATGERGLAGYTLGTGEWLAGAGYGVPVRLWGVGHSSAEGTAVAGTPATVQTLTVYPDAEGQPMLAVAGVGGAVVVHHLPSRTRRFAFRYTEGFGVDVLTAFLRADGRRLLVTARRDTPVRFWDAATGDEVDCPLGRHTDGVRTLTVFTATDGRRLAVIVREADRSAQVRDTATGEAVAGPLTAALAGAHALATVRLPYRHDLVAAIGRDTTVRLWDTVTGSLVREVDTGRRLVAVTAFDGTNRWPQLAVAAAGGGVRVWDVAALLHADPALVAGSDGEGYVVWLLSCLDTGHGVPERVLDLLLEGGAMRDVPWYPGRGHWRELLSQGVIGALPSGAIAVASGQEHILTALARPNLETFDATAVHSLLELCREPTADPATWSHYVELGPVLPRLLDRILSASSPTPQDPWEVLTLVEHYCRFCLLRGEPGAADALIGLAEAWTLRAVMVQTDRTRAAVWRNRSRLVSLRARMACGKPEAVRDREESIMRHPGNAPEAVAEATLCEVELSLWEGSVVRARDDLAAAGAPTRADPGYDHQVVQRLIVCGELEAAATALRARGRVPRQPPPADGPGQVERTIAELTTAGRTVFLTAWLSTVLDSVADAATATFRPYPPPLLGSDWRWHPAGRRMPLPALGREVPADYLDLCVAFTEVWVEDLVRRAAGPLWSADGHIAEVPSYFADAQALVEELREVRAPLRTTRPHMYARFLTVEGRVLVAAREPGAAQRVLTEAIELTTQVYGPRSPLLPRLELLLARAFALAGRQSDAARRVAAAEALLDTLHGPIQPHQDRLTALLARSTLPATAADRERAARRARDMAATYLRTVAPVWPNNRPP